MKTEPPSDTVMSVAAELVLRRFTRRLLGLGDLSEQQVAKITHMRDELIAELNEPKSKTKGR